MFLLRNKKKLSFNYPQYLLLSGALCTWKSCLLRGNNFICYPGSVFPSKKGVHLKERILGVNYFLQKLTPLRREAKMKMTSTFPESLPIHFVKVQGLVAQN